MTGEGNLLMEEEEKVEVFNAFFHVSLHESDHLSDHEHSWKKG